MGEQKIGAATRRNHEGMPSSPVAVEQSVIVSKILKTRYSEMKSLLGCRTVCFNAGGIYTVSQKKQDTKLLAITPLTIMRFSKIFH